MDVHVAGNESRHVKSQIHPTDAFRVGRPAEPAVADATQPAIGSVAEARGGAARHSKANRLYPKQSACLGFKLGQTQPVERPVGARLFREATQLKTGRANVGIGRAKILKTEI